MTSPFAWVDVHVLCNVVPWRWRSCPDSVTATTGMSRSQPSGVPDWTTLDRPRIAPSWSMASAKPKLHVIARDECCLEARTTGRPDRRTCLALVPHGRHRSAAVEAPDGCIGCAVPAHVPYCRQLPRPGNGDDRLKNRISQDLTCSCCFRTSAGECRNGVSRARSQCFNICSKSRPEKDAEILQGYLL
jgi:hypothetical protein